jgi:hypothetical protein
MAGGFGVGVTWVTAHIRQVCFAAPQIPPPKNPLAIIIKNSGDNRGYKEKRLRRLRGS